MRSLVQVEELLTMTMPMLKSLLTESQGNSSRLRAGTGLVEGLGKK